MPRHHPAPETDPRAAKKPKLLAEPAYENGHLVARDLAERLGELLADRPAPGGEWPIHWGHVGDVAHVNALLAQAIAFLNPFAK